MLLQRAGVWSAKSNWSSACASGAKVSNNFIPRSYIHRLRKKIEKAPSGEPATVRGLGITWKNSRLISGIVAAMHVAVGDFFGGGRAPPVALAV